MRGTEATVLFQYNEWANMRILARASGLAAGQLSAQAAVSHGSLLGTLLHIFSAELVWRTRCRDRSSPAAMPSLSDYPDLRSLETDWLTEMRLMREFVGTLSPGQLDHVITYASTKGLHYATPLWQILLHVVNHGTQFRSEAAVLMTEVGASPGDLDLIAYLRDRQS
jgi:uncharacterized damage-inducible protein DinB